LTYVAILPKRSPNKAASAWRLFSIQDVFEDMSDEAHLPTEQSRPRTAARIPEPDVNSGRSCSDPGPPRTRPQEAVRLTIIRKRADFVAANAARRVATPGFVLLVRDRCDSDPVKRLGITVTKKIGNAVVRNRMKRRFRALAHDVLGISGKAGADHVLIGRAGGVERDFARLRDDLVKAAARATT
jgi:ribonuclease P protein component